MIKLMEFLNSEMVAPKPWGWFHLLWLTISICFVIYFFITRKKSSEKETKIVLLTYGVIALILELLKQIAWSYNLDPDTGRIIWDYQWYAAPYQLCTTPIYASLLYCIFKNKNIKESLLGFLAFITIWGSIMTMVMPDSCFVKTILVDIHTMYLHCGSFVVSMYIIIKRKIPNTFKMFLNAFKVFLVFASFAMVLNLLFYNTGIIGDETFNMFYISPYFISSLPVFDTIQENVPYLVFLLIYLIAFFLGGIVIFLLYKLYSRKRK